MINLEANKIYWCIPMDEPVIVASFDETMIICLMLDRKTLIIENKSGVLREPTLGEECVYWSMAYCLLLEEHEKLKRKLPGISLN